MIKMGRVRNNTHQHKRFVFFKVRLSAIQVDSEVELKVGITSPPQKRVGTQQFPTPGIRRQAHVQFHFIRGKGIYQVGYDDIIPRGVGRYHSLHNSSYWRGSTESPCHNCITSCS